MLGNARALIESPDHIEKMLNKKVTLCGSTKFKREFEAINRQLTLEGYIVYSVSCFGHADKIPFTQEQKDILDTIHKAKIDNSDAILVIDVEDYIGSSTRSEIEHAHKTGKVVAYLSDIPDLKMLCDNIIFDGRNGRRSGRTTRLIDAHIQEFFDTGKCICSDHTERYYIFERSKHLQRKLIKRLQYEHRLTDDDIEMNGLQLIYKNHKNNNHATTK